MKLSEDKRLFAIFADESVDEAFITGPGRLPEHVSNIEMLRKAVAFDIAEANEMLKKAGLPVPTS